MSIGDFLVQATGRLEEAGITSARLDSLVLLEDSFGRERSWLLAHPETTLSSAQHKKLVKQLDRRAAHEPLAYIRGFSEFYGRKFKVNKHVLEPRPESETMIDLLKKLRLPRSPKIADVGTGSGCLGITAALEIHPSRVDLYDIDSGALAVARHNEHMYELDLHIHKRDLLNRPTSSYDVVLANLPYIPDRWRLHKSILMEPRIAFLGGKDGLDLYRRLFTQLEALPKRPQYVLTEALPPQHRGLEKIALSHGFSRLRQKDFIQVFRSD